MNVIAREDYESIRHLYESRQTMKQIGKQFGVSHERIRQILKANYGITAKSFPKRADTRKSECITEFLTKINHSEDYCEQILKMFLDAASHHGLSVSYKVTVTRFVRVYVNGRKLRIANPRRIHKTNQHSISGYLTLHINSDNPMLIIVGSQDKAVGYFFEKPAIKTHYIKPSVINSIIGKRLIIFDCGDVCQQFGKRRNIPDQEIKALFDECIPFRDIATQTGLSLNEVYYRANRLGFRSRRSSSRYQHWSSSDIDNWGDVLDIPEYSCQQIIESILEYKKLEPL